ncbi:DUF2079 domain-containing protein [Amycolatopsis cihanbeyliensis]|uniref:4-amino-4-deoxy-L-arabinose transferase-like glycosyltransferase n=1 Tax=Amycolatopsis cihanbeyliensis TaxID=1128664 RepID=A0A542DCX4_AMYCI|nr:DUF2079 domain-containing protein [Amycolatopsis cihanbeyliensis]TQJ00906.1 hypothetical protein FB471_0557 [Amycolatopsis cihanbeyliensis]
MTFTDIPAEPAWPRASPGAGTGRRPAAIALGLLTLVPLLLAVVQAARAPRMHLLLDYWHVLAKITGDDGSLVAGKIASYHLDQPFVLPSLLFWLDAAILGGDNRVFSVLTVAFAVAIVLLLGTMLPSTLDSGKKWALTSGFAFLVLSSHAAELWVQATNGISWVPAVLCSVLALRQAHRGRSCAAYASAAVGCLCFGAAFPVWFALALTGWLARRGRAAVLVPAAAGIGVLAFWFATKPSGPQSLATSALDPSGRLSVLGAALGCLWSAELAVVAVLAGGATAAVLLLTGWSAVRARLSDPAGPAGAAWVGLGAYALMLAGMLALGRTTDAPVPGGNVGLISRYVLVSALATCAALTLLVLHRPRLPRRRVIALVLTISFVTYAIGGTKASGVDSGYAPLGVTAVALRVGAEDALRELRIEPGVRPAAQALGAYPFTGDFSLGCGGHELDDRLDLPAAVPLPGPESPSPSRGVVDTAPAAGGVLLSGWVTLDGRQPDCVLVADGIGTVVGGGVTGLPRPDVPGPASGWRAAAAPGTTRPTVVILAGRTLHRLTSTGVP